MNMTQEDNAATQDPIMEESDTCFDNLRVTRNAIKLNPNVIQQVARAKPAKLATAFPPLKPANIGQQCPIVAPKGASIKIVKPLWKKFSPNLLKNTSFKLAKLRIRYTIIIGKTVFIASKIMVAAPNFLPKTRPTLVPPEFFDPKLRGSSCLKSLQSMTPVGIEPKKYPKINDSKQAIILYKIISILILPKTLIMIEKSAYDFNIYFVIINF